MNQQILKDLEDRFIFASNRWPKHPSLQHSAWVIKEEYEEFNELLRAKDDEFPLDKIYNELIDIMNTCYRAIIDNNLLSEK